MTARRAGIVFLRLVPAPERQLSISQSPAPKNRNWTLKRLQLLVTSQRGLRSCKKGGKMAPLVRRSILKKFLIVVSCLPICVAAPLAWAQHPASRTAGGVVHMPPPPIFHLPISPVPMIHAPISAPRISAAPSAGALGTAGFRPPRRPIRPFPPVLVVYESPPFFSADHSGD